MKLEIYQQVTTQKKYFKVVFHSLVLKQYKIIETYLED